jgi:hypothetical protein
MMLKMTIEEATSILKQKFLFTTPGVVGLGYNAEHEGADRDTIRVYVEDYKAAERIPYRLLGFPTEVVVSGRPRALLSTIPRTRQIEVTFVPPEKRQMRWRPVPGGVSVVSMAYSWELGIPRAAGTMGSRVYDAKTGRRLMLSNYHVFYGKEGTPVIQPGTYDGGTYPDDLVGYIYRYVEVKPHSGVYPPPPEEINYVDAAVAVPVSDDILSDEVLDVGVVTKTKSAELGKIVCKSGRTTGFTCGRVTDLHLSTTVLYDFHKYRFEAYFEDQIYIEPGIMSRGDSGSLFVERDAAIGLGFASTCILCLSEMGAIANKIEHVMSLLDVTFTPPTTPTPPTPPTPPTLPTELMEAVFMSLPLVAIGAVISYDYVSSTWGR